MSILTCSVWESAGNGTRDVLDDNKDTSGFSEHELLDIMYNACNTSSTGTFMPYIDSTRTGWNNYVISESLFLRLSRPQEKCWPPPSCSTCSPWRLRVRSRTDWLPCDACSTPTVRTLMWAERLSTPPWGSGSHSVARTGETELHINRTSSWMSCSVYRVSTGS